MKDFVLAIVPPLHSADEPGPLARALCRAVSGAFLALPGEMTAASDLVYDLAPSFHHAVPAGRHAGLFQPLRSPESARADLVDRARLTDLVITGTPEDQAWLAGHGIEATLIPDAVNAAALLADAQLLEAVVTRHLAAFRSLLAEGPQKPQIPVASDPSVRLLVHGLEAQGHTLGGPSLRVPATARRLREQGVRAVAGHFDTAAGIAEDIVHLFNVWHPKSALPALRSLKAAGKRVVFSPIFLDFTLRDFWEFDLPATPGDQSGWEKLLQTAEHHARGRGRMHEPLPGYHAMLREMIALADRIVLLSEAERRALLAIGAAVGPERAEVIRNAIDLDAWQPADPDLFRQTWLAGQPGPQDYVLTVGRIEQRKNQLMLARAMKGLPLRLVVVGHDGEPVYAARLREEGGDQLLHIPRLPPAGEMLRSALQGASVFALPSWSEGASLAALEAAAMGSPLLLGDHPGEREYYGDLVDYAEPGDPGALRDGILQILARAPETKASRAAALRRHLAQKNDPQEHVHALARLYKDLAQASRPAVSAPAALPLGEADPVIDVTALGGPENGLLLWPASSSRPAARLIRHMPQTGRFGAEQGTDLTDLPLDWLTGGETLLVLAPEGLPDPAHAAALSDLRAERGIRILGLLQDPVAITAPWRLPAEGLAAATDSIRRLLDLVDALILPASEMMQDLRFAAAMQGVVLPPLLLQPPLAPLQSTIAADPDQDPELMRLIEGIGGRAFVMPVSPLQARYNIDQICRIWQVLCRDAAEGGPPPPVLVLPGPDDADTRPVIQRMMRHPLTAAHILILKDVSAAARDWLLRHALFTLCLADEASGQGHVLTGLDRGRPCLASPAALPEARAKEPLAGPDPQDLPGWMTLIRQMVSGPEKPLPAGTVLPLPLALPAGDSLSRHRPLPSGGGIIPAGAESWRAGLVFGAGWHPAGETSRRMAAERAVLDVDCRQLLRGNSQELGLILRLHPPGHPEGEGIRPLTITLADRVLWQADQADLPGTVILRLPPGVLEDEGLLRVTLQTQNPGDEGGLELRWVALFDPAHDNPLTLLAPATEWIDGSAPAGIDFGSGKQRKQAASRLIWNPARGVGSATGRFEILLPILPGAPFRRIMLRGRAAEAGLLRISLNGVAIGQQDLKPDMTFLLECSLDPALLAMAAPAVLRLEMEDSGRTARVGADGIAGAALLFVGLFAEEVSS